MPLRLNREGEVRAIFSSDNQCKEKGHTSYSYKVSITYSGNLDSRGFITDHNLIDKVIQLYFSHTEIKSCELVCIEICNIIDRFLQTQNIYIADIYFKLAPIGSKVNAYMEYSKTGNFI